ncbi:MAG TPA: (2Fe-2S)-binding protein [Streptosporangiaceae bacterium]|jgi:predicted molibdopterin-dependent oxidoreductase YjgC|nr:(2Fe-2S)-binding protein [Streptosporangiaceae bacterium]
MPDDPVRFTFDGTALEAECGMTIGGALLTNGIMSWRRTRSGGSPRGIFCAIGVCFDCLVDVAPHRAVRACLVQVHDGDVVTTSSSLGPAE